METAILAWVLVVVVGTEPSNYHVSGKGTSELLSRRQQSFATKTECDNAKRTALARASQRMGMYPVGRYPFEPVVAISCVPVEKPRPRSSRNHE